MIEKQTQMPIYTHFPVDFMIPAVEVKATIAAKVNAKSEEYELYYRKAPEEGKRSRVIGFLDEFY